MKFRTRLQITFATIIILPLVLTALAFLCIGGYLLYPKEKLGITEIDYSMLSGNIQSYGKITEDLYLRLKAEIDKDPVKAEDITFLEDVNDAIAKKFSYIIVRKEGQMYYAGDETAEIIFERLPLYGSSRSEADKIYYFNDVQRLVKQIDFPFSDGTEGSLLS